MRSQHTVKCEDRKIKIVVRSKSRAGNLAGYRASVSDTLGNRLDISHLPFIDPMLAEDTAYGRFVQKFC